MRQRADRVPRFLAADSIRWKALRHTTFSLRPPRTATFLSSFALLQRYSYHIVITLTVFALFEISSIAHTFWNTARTSSGKTRVIRSAYAKATTTMLT